MELEGSLTYLQQQAADSNLRQMNLVYNFTSYFKISFNIIL
jgi:hypothetical protein